MPRHIAIIIGHPDGSPKRLCRALAASYAEGARSCGRKTWLAAMRSLGQRAL